jgi:hypothetical protein
MVKISIDTKDDSHDHIKHVITMLQNIVGSAPTNAPSSPDSGYVNIFAENPAQSEPEPQATAPEPSFFNIFGDEPAPSQPEPVQSQVVDMPVAQAAPVQQETPAQQLGIETVTPQRAPPRNAPPEVDMFAFFSKAKSKITPY